MRDRYDELLRQQEHKAEMRFIFWIAVFGFSCSLVGYGVAQ